MTVKLGQILIRHRFITPAQLEEGLTVQVTNGGRLGSNLVDLGCVSVDDVARALGSQHGVAAASDEAFRSVKSAALDAVPREMCAKYGVCPLAIDKKTLHLAMRDPRQAGLLAALSKELPFEQIKPYATPDLRLLYFLELLYQIPRPKRYLHATSNGDAGWRGNLEPTVGRAPVAGQAALRQAPIEQRMTGPQLAVVRPQTQVSQTPQTAEDSEFELVYLDEHEKEAEEEDSIFDLDIDISFDEASATSATSTSQKLSTGELLAKLQQASERETILSLLITPVLSRTSISLVLLPRGELAVGLGASGTEVSPGQVRQLVVPLNTPSLVKEAFESKELVRGEVQKDALQQMIANYLRVEIPREAMVAPIVLGPKVVNLLCVQTTSSFDESAVTELSQIAAQAAIAYRRLIINKRGSA